MSAYTIIRADHTHVPAIHLVECDAFSHPWSEESLLAELNNGYSILFVAVKNDEVVGWAGLESICGEGSVTNIAVQSDCRRCGIGRALTQVLIDEAAAQHLESLQLEVRVSNTAAITLYEDLGFTRIGVRPRFYEDPREDALLMRIDFTNNRT